MIFYETEAGSAIYAVKILSSDECLLDTQHGQSRMDIWNEQVVGGISKCYLHELPEFKDAKPDTWFTPLREEVE